MSGSDDADVLTVPTRTVGFRGKALVLGPLKLRQIGPFITAARTIIARVSVAAGLLGEAQPLQVGAVILDLFEQDAGSLADALAIASGEDAAFIADGSLDEVTALVEAVVAVNKDFFSQRLPALLAKAAVPKASAPAQASPSVGPTTSTTSSAADTASPTSSA